MVAGFLHLNLHTDRSQFVGLITPAQLVDWGKREGLSAVAVTDHHNISAAVQLYKHCKVHRLKPIYGMEASICPDKTKKDRGTNNLVLIAKNRVGFRNLIILSTIGSMYFYYRPRIDFDDLRKYGEGLIATTACLFGLTAAGYIRDHSAGLQAEWQRLHDIFGPDLWLELQPVLKDMQRNYNEACLALAVKDSRVQLLVTGDPHYYESSDREFHEHFMKVRIVDPSWKYPFVGPYHLRTYAEMVDQFADLHGYDVTGVPQIKGAFDAPDGIAEQVDHFDIKESVKIPSYFHD